MNRFGGAHAIQTAERSVSRSSDGDVHTSKFRTGTFFLLLCGLSAAPACVFEPNLPRKPIITCQANAECARDWVCLRERSICVSAQRECLANNESDFVVPVADGSLCSAGICISGECSPPRCGDGYVLPPEMCDDPALLSTGECKSDCTWNVCGDQVVHPGVEECDDGNDVDGDGCDRGCVRTRCGNGVVSPDEVCDDGNVVDGDGCDRNCTVTACGNGVVSAGESCDDGNDQDGDGCDSNCRPSGCGNGIVAPPEECDDSNDNDADTCTNACRVARCGDGILHAGELCDDGNESDADDCTADCRSNVCGDGILNPDTERCDDGNTSNSDGCLNTCEPNRCGDGFRNEGVEECDDGNKDNSDTCLNLCLRNTCGDGYVDRTVEECDDGNTSGGDACTSDCRVNVCGDGDVQPILEACDDGNLVSGDGCRSDCRKIEACGDGEVDFGEACDDGNQNPRDGCNACRLHSWSGNWVVGGRRRVETGMDAALSLPGDVVVDSSGNVIFSNTGTHQLLRLSPDGALHILAGLGFAGRVGDVPVRALRAALHAPRGIALEPQGTILFAESGANRIRRLRADGTLETVAGRNIVKDRAVELGQDGVLAVDTDLLAPYDVAVNALGRIYIAEFGGQRVRVVGLDGEINTVAGGGSEALTPQNSGTLLASEAALSQVAAVAVDMEGRVLFAEPYLHRVVRVEHDATLTMVAGNGTRGFSGDEGDARDAQLSGPFAIDVDRNNVLWIADQFNHRLRRVQFLANGASRITTVAGGGDGEASPVAPALDVKLESPRGLFSAPSGSVWLVEFGGHRLLELSTSGQLSVRGGTGAWATPGAGEMQLSASINDAAGIAVAQDGTLYFGDKQRNLIYGISVPDGVRHVAGTYFAGFNPLEPVATKSPIDDPRGMAFAPDGSLYFADRDNHCIRRIRFSADVETIEQAVGQCGAQNGGFSGDFGPAAQAKLQLPQDVFVQQSGSVALLWVADTGNGVIRRVSLDEEGNPLTIETYVGGNAVSQGGLPSARENYALQDPVAIAVDAVGRVYISEQDAHRVVRVDLDGWVRELAGTGLGGFNYEEGPAANVKLHSPTGLALDASGDLYIADRDNGRVRKVSMPSGSSAAMRTIAGTGLQSSAGDGGPALFASLTPSRMVVGTDGKLYVSDTDRIRTIETDESSLRRIDTAVGGLYFEKSFGRNDDVILIDAVHLARAGPFLFSSSGQLGYVHGLNLDTSVAAPLIGYPDAAPAVTGFAPWSPLLGFAAGLFYDSETSVLYISDAGNLDNTQQSVPGIRMVQITTESDGSFRPPSTWRQNTKAFPRGGVSHLEFDVQVSVGVTSELEPIEVVEGQVLSFALTASEETVNPTFEMRVQLDAPPSATSYDCDMSTSSGIVQCELRVPAGVSFAYVHITGPAAGTAHVQVDIDTEMPWVHLWGLTSDDAGQHLLVADPGAHCIRRITKSAEPAGSVYGICGERGEASGLLSVPTDVLVSPFTGAMYIADSNNHRVLRVSPTGDVALVIGDGTPSSAGSGQPANRFPVERPFALAMDEWGNLYIAAHSNIRMIANVGEGLDAEGDDLALTIFDGHHPLLQGGGAPECMSALEIDEDQHLYVADGCEGFILQLAPAPEQQR